MALWCLMASPLFYSGDMTRLDEFTLNILCNTEVIEVNQDPLGQCARVVKLGGDSFLMVKNHGRRQQSGRVRQRRRTASLD